MPTFSDETAFLPPSENYPGNLRETNNVGIKATGGGNGDARYDPYEFEPFGICSSIIEADSKNMDVRAIN